MALSFLDKEQAEWVAREIKKSLAGKGMDINMHITTKIEGGIPKYRVWTPDLPRY